MNKTGLINDHLYKELPGTLSGIFIKGWQGNLLPEIPNKFSFSEKGWKWNETGSGEQLSLEEDTVLKIQFSEDLLESVTQTYWTSDLFNITVNFEKLVEDTVFYNIKESRTFEKLTIDKVSSNDLNNWIRLWIRSEILPNIQLDLIQVWTNLDSQTGVSKSAFSGSPESRWEIDWTVLDKTGVIKFQPLSKWFSWFLKVYWKKR
jgi:hypothetical protein